MSMMYINKMSMMYINKMSMIYINKMSMMYINKMSMMYIIVYINVTIKLKMRTISLFTNMKENYLNTNYLTYIIHSKWRMVFPKIKVHVLKYDEFKYGNPNDWKHFTIYFTHGLWFKVSKNMSCTKDISDVIRWSKYLIEAMNLASVLHMSTN
jgi:hypothetical protein